MLMKKIAYLLAGMTMAAWISGCSTPEIVTEDVGATYSAAFYEGGKDSLVMEISLEWPVSGLPAVAMENIQKGLISNIFGKDYSALGIEQAIGRYLQEETETYRSNSSDFMKMIQKNEDDIMTGMFSWVETSDGEFLPPYMNMQSYILSTYDYTGGAHGIDAEKGMTFDLSKGKQLKEDDLFVREYKPELSRILSANMKKSLDEEIYGMLFIMEIEPNGNFYVSDEGVTYIYNRYEIGPYVSGIVRVTVPWEELKDILR